MAKLDPRVFPESDTVWAFVNGASWGCLCLQHRRAGRPGVRPALVRLRRGERVGRGNKGKKEGERERRGEGEGKERENKGREEERRRRMLYKNGFLGDWRGGLVIKSTS